MARFFQGLLISLVHGGLRFEFSSVLLLTKRLCSVLESPTDELLVEIQDIKGASQGRCVIPLSSMNDDPVSTRPLTVLMYLNEYVVVNT